MSRKTMTYECPKCGHRHPYNIEGLEDNTIADLMWPDDTDETWPPYAICGRCAEDDESVRMYPDLKGPSETVECGKCDFEVGMPRFFPTGWRCPECRSGLMK